MNFKRLITEQAKKHLDSKDVLLFIGARQVGKTTILKQLKSHLESQKKSCYFLNLEDPEYLELLNKSPKNLFKILSLDLKKRNYIFIDEIQYLDNPSNFLKYFYDEYASEIKLLVSGSSAFYLDSKFKDSLAGRKKIFYVRTLSFREFLIFKQENDLSRLDFSSLSVAEKDLIARYFDEYIIWGGYPRVVLSDLDAKEDVLRELAYSYIKKDIYESKVRDEKTFYSLLKILAAQVGSLVNSSELAATLGVSKSSIDNYLGIIQKSFHIYLIKPYSNNMRKELTKMPKVFFADYGLRNFLVNNFEPYTLRSDKGELLENIVFRQLLENNHPEQVNFWRTADKQEVDFVINGKDAWEVKAQANRFKANKYKKFLESYPDIELKVATLNFDVSQVNEIDGHKLINVLEI